jgi:UDP-3-O-[3-hydroxymyristoyl] glucosamine N-acyltransferase
VIGPGCVLEAGCVVGADSRLVARVFLGRDTQLGERVLVHPGVVIGADGFGLAFDRDHWIKVPQMGRVRIGHDCEIGANTTIDRGAIEDTVLEDDVRLDNQVQIAHNVQIGAHTAIAGCVGIAGSTRVGRYCMIAGASGVAGHLEICDKVVITAMSTVLDSITEPGEYGSGIPARAHARWKRTLVRLGQLDDWVRRLRRIEKNNTTAKAEKKS